MAVGWGEAEASSQLAPLGMGFLALPVEIDDDVRDRDGEPFAGVLDDAPLEPVRTSLGMGRDDDLVGTERAERVLHRLQRVGVADLPGGVDAERAQSLEAGVEALLGGPASSVLVGGPVAAAAS